MRHNFAGQSDKRYLFRIAYMVRGGGPPHAVTSLGNPTPLSNRFYSLNPAATASP